MSRWLTQSFCLAIACLAFTFLAIHEPTDFSDQHREHLMALRRMLGQAEQAGKGVQQSALSQPRLRVETKAITKAQLGPAVPVVVKPTKSHPVWEIQVPGHMNLDAETRKLYERMAGILSKAVTAVPEDRWEYFSAINHPPEWVIERWIGVVRDVVAQGDGSYVVTASAHPKLLNLSQFGVMADYSERYLVSGGMVHYLGFLDPKHGFGKLPPIVCY